MADNSFDIKIGIQLENDGRGFIQKWEQIKEKIEQPLNIKFNFGNNLSDSIKQVLQMNNELIKLNSTINNLSGHKDLEIFNPQKTNVQIKDTLKCLSDVQKALKDIGLYSNNNEIKIRIDQSQIDKDSKEINKFMVLVKEMSGLTKEFSFSHTDAGNDGVAGYNGELIRVIDTTHKATNELEQFRNKYQQSINQMKDTGLLNDDSIKNFEQQLNNLNTDNFKNNINSIKTSFKELENQLKTVQQQIENTQKVVNFSNNMSNNIDNLYADSKGVDLNRLGELSSKNNNLVDYNNVDELENIKKLYEEIIQLKKQYISQENQQQKEEEKLYNYLFTQEERLKNIRGSYNTKLDNGSNEFGKLESEYNSLIQKLEDYRQRGEKLTVQETTDIKSRINSFNQEKNSVIEITKIIQQQEQALQSLHSRFGSLVDLQEINKIKSSISGLSTSTNFKGDNSGVTNEINQLRQLATERERIQGLGTNLGSGTGLNLGSSVSEIQTYLKSVESGKVQFNQLSESVDNANNRVKQIHYTVDQGNGLFQKYTLNVDSASGSVYKLDRGIIDATSHQKSFGDTLKSALESVTGFSLISGAYFTTISAIKDMIVYTGQMDNALTDLNKVVDLSKSQLDDMKQSALELGEALGKDSVSVMASMGEAGRQFKDTEDIKKFTETAVMASNVTDMSAQQATKSLTTVMKVFKQNINDVQGDLDSFNEIQNNFRKKLCGSKTFSNGLGSLVIRRQGASVMVA